MTDENVARLRQASRRAPARSPTDAIVLAGRPARARSSQADGAHGAGGAYGNVRMALNGM